MGGGEAGERRELEEECADGRLMDSFFMLREERGLGGDSKGLVKGSETGEERAEGEEESSEARTIRGLCWGVSMRRAVRGNFLHGTWTWAFWS